MTLDHSIHAKRDTSPPSDESVDWTCIQQLTCDGLASHSRGGPICRWNQETGPNNLAWLEKQHAACKMGEKIVNYWDYVSFTGWKEFDGRDLSISWTLSIILLTTKIVINALFEFNKKIWSKYQKANFLTLQCICHLDALNQVKITLKKTLAAMKQKARYDLDPNVVTVGVVFVYKQFRFDAGDQWPKLFQMSLFCIFKQTTL